MTEFALLFTLSAVGISEAAYLIKKRIAAQRPVCIIGEDCATVLSSKYSTLFGIPNDVLGMLLYLFTATAAALLVIGAGPVALLHHLLDIAVAGASLMSLVLVYIQGRVIHAWCFWCLMSACTIWLMGVILLA